MPRRALGLSRREVVEVALTDLEKELIARESYYLNLSMAEHMRRSLKSIYPAIDESRLNWLRKRQANKKGIIPERTRNNKNGTT